MKASDLLIFQQPDGNWATVKILVVDIWADGSETFHCLSYSPVHDKPTEATLGELKVMVSHAPIAAEGFQEHWQVLCSRPVTDDELGGFNAYLKLTDFPRYLEFTGQDPRELVSRANGHYKNAVALGDAGKRLEAIEEYSIAIDLFPPFYEAVDNRAFTYMELGDYAAALDDFETSLRIHPDGHVAFFSRGECLLMLGLFDDAERVFDEGVSHFPEHKAIFLQFLEATRLKKSLQAKSNPAG